MAVSGEAQKVKCVFVQGEQIVFERQRERRSRLWKQKYLRLLTEKKKKKTARAFSHPPATLSAGSGMENLR